MTIGSHKIVTVAAVVFFLAVSFASAYASQPLLLLIPLLSVAAAMLASHPMLLFYMLLASIPWSVEYNFTLALGTDLPDEPLMLLMAAVATTLLIYQRHQLSKLHPLILLLILQMSWLAVTVLASTHPLLSLKFIAAKCWYLPAFVAAPLVLSDHKKLVRRGGLVLLVSMFAVTMVGLVRHALTGFSFATVNDALQPFFRNHVNYSALLVFMLPIAVAFFHGATHKRRRRLLGVGIIILLAALYFSYARGAWLAAGVGAIGYWLLKKGWLLHGYVIAIAFVVCAAFWLHQNNRYLQFAPNHDRTIFHQTFSEHLSATYTGRDVSTAERFYRWVAAANMAKQHPLTGYGPSTFYRNYRPYTEPLFRTWVSNNPEQSTVHNYFLLLLVEQGIPGLLLFLILLGAMLWYAQRIYHRSNDPFWKSAVAIAAVIIFMQCTLNFLSDLIETDKVGSVFYLCVAVLVISDRRQKADDRRLKRNIQA